MLSLENLNVHNTGLILIFDGLISDQSAFKHNEKICNLTKCRHHHCNMLFTMVTNGCLSPRKLRRQTCQLVFLLLDTFKLQVVSRACSMLPNVVFLFVVQFHPDGARGEGHAMHARYR